MSKLPGLDRSLFTETRRFWNSIAQQRRLQVSPFSEVLPGGMEGVAGRTTARNATSWTVTLGASCFAGQNHIGGFAAMLRVMTLSASDLEMFAVVKLTANQPAVGNDWSGYERSAVR